MGEIPANWSLDRETWLTLLAPGTVLAGAAYVAFPGLRTAIVTLTAGLGPESQAVVLAFLGTSAALILGVASSILCRLLDRIPWGVKWPKCLFTHRWPLYPPKPEYVAHFRFGGELLPYSALRALWHGSPQVLGTAPDMTRKMAERVVALVGNKQDLPTPLELLSVTVKRQYSDLASDAVKAWVIANIGTGVSREAWDFAAKFRHMGDAYRSLALALPVSLLVMSAAPVTSGIAALSASWPWRPLTGTAALFLAWVVILVSAFIVMWLCQLQAMVNWIQWQGELCRLFYVASDGPVLEGQPAGH